MKNLESHDGGRTFDTIMLPPADRGPKLGDILEPEVDPKYTLTEHLWKYLQDYKKKHTAAGNGFGYSLFGPNDVTRTLSQRAFFFDTPAIEKGWHGKPARRTWCPGMSSGFSEYSRMSPAIGWLSG